MTPAQIRLLQRSFAAIEPVKREVGLSFYERLFELAPESRSLFKSDIDRQQDKFLSIIEQFLALKLRSLLTLPVNGAGSTGEVTMPGMFDLAKRHTGYGVELEYFEAGKQALLWSIERHLGEQCDEETLEAWGEAYDIIAGSMVRVMNEEATPPTLPYEHDRTAPETQEETLDLLFRQ